VGLDDVVTTLLPTPKASDSTRGVSPAETRRKDPSLTAVEFLLLPTPTATDSESSGRTLYGLGVTLTDAARSIGTSTQPQSGDGNDG
jgi:hypothetical protein